MTTANDSSVPPAQTFDEPLLREVFPTAPADLAVPEDVGTIRSAKLKDFFERRRSVMVVLALALLAAAAIGAAVGGIGLGGAMLVIGLIIWCIPLAFVASSAGDEFFQSYAIARGLTNHDEASIRAEVPLFGKGDKRDFRRVLEGNVAGRKARLGHYTYTVVTRDSEGNRSEADHDYTVLAYELPPAVAARFAGVYLSPGSMSFGKLQDSFSHDRKVQLESKEFEDRYNLRVVDGQDDIALYELFSPTFIHHLATDLKIHWEQVGEDLVFWRKGHEDRAADLDRFCSESRYVLQRYLDEHR